MRKGHPYVPTRVGPKGAFFLTAPSGPHSRTSERDGTHDLPLMEVMLVNQREIPDAQCIQSTLRISLRDPFEAVIESVDVQHFFFTAWPDHGVPNDAIPIIKLVHLVDDANSKGGMGSVAPVLVHCSAGVGRTGTFIAISSMFRLFKLLPDVSNDGLGDPTEDQRPAISPLGRMSQTVSEDLVALEIDGLRELRPGMLQRPEQVLFVYVVLAHALALGKVLGGGDSHGA
jgi:protein tyrosine phosphatase